jgi:hypothetical protein
MSVSCKFERSLLSHEEHETIRVTHHPAIYEHDAEGLKTLRVRLRQMRDKERTLTRQKRVNKELSRVHKLEARTAHVEAAWRALALRRAAQFAPYPAAGDTANEGMRPLPSQRRRTKVPPAKVGSVSQATKVAQAARDSRT